MVRLHDLIAALQVAAKTHGNIECAVTCHDDRQEICGSEMPSIHFNTDAEQGHWIEISFEGRYARLDD